MHKNSHIRNIDAKGSHQRRWYANQKRKKHPTPPKCVAITHTFTPTSPRNNHPIHHCIPSINNSTTINLRIALWHSTGTQDVKHFCKHGHDPRKKNCHGPSHRPHTNLITIKSTLLATRQQYRGEYPLNIPKHIKSLSHQSTTTLHNGAGFGTLDFWERH